MRNQCALTHRGCRRAEQLGNLLELPEVLPFGTVTPIGAGRWTDIKPGRSYQQAFSSGTGTLRRRYARCTPAARLSKNTDAPAR